MGSRYALRTVHQVMFTILFIAAVAGIAAADFIPTPIEYLPKKSDCVTDSASVLFPGPNACDGNPATLWITAGPTGNGYPHWVIVNLVKTSRVSYVSFATQAITSAAVRQVRVDTWNGTQWKVSSNVFAFNYDTNSTVLLEGDYMTSAIRVVFLSDAASSNDAGLRDVWIFGYSNLALKSPSPSGNILLILFFLGMLWLGFFVAGTGLKTGFFVILSGVSALLFAITAWTTTNDIPSSILLFAAAVFTLIWSLRVIMEERSVAG